MIFSFSHVAGLSSDAGTSCILHVFGLHVVSNPRLRHQVRMAAGCQNRHRLHLPRLHHALCAIGVAMETALASVPGPTGNVSRDSQRHCRTTQRDIAISSEGPPVGCGPPSSPPSPEAGFGPRRIGPILLASPFGGSFIPSGKLLPVADPHPTTAAAPPFNVFVHCFADRHTKMPRPGRSQHARGQRGVRHQRRRIRMFSPMRHNS